MRRRFIDKVDRCVQRLPEIECKLIKLRYMDDDYVFDYNVYEDELGRGYEAYAKRRWRAFERLAGMLKIGILKEKGDDGGGSSGRE
ncbi:hypothetical protein [Cohnella sp. WQ 127256]|uniref:hypothetical protein n=1 Tax=Cohnella sp. WQ 127256 TaxID=2938790 RepID=UPI0021188429|nr:hypothetical protein [Cohnella sp. WQ 127256]